MLAANEVCPLIVLAANDVCPLIVLAAYDICCIMTFVGYEAYGVCRRAYCHHSSRDRLGFKAKSQIVLGQCSQISSFLVLKKRLFYIL